MQDKCVAKVPGKLSDSRTSYVASFIKYVGIKYVYVNQLRKLFAEVLIVTEAIYDVRESDNVPRTFATLFNITKFHEK